VPAAFWLGEALAASGRCAEAVAEFERVERLFVSRFTVPWRPGFWAESQVRRARCLAELGRSAEAAAALDRFLAAWRRADPDLPLLAEARVLRGRVQEPGRSRQ
jgi:TolA-binding protein